MIWQPSLGAFPTPGGTCFRLWAPNARSMELILYAENGAETAHPMQAQADGYFSCTQSKIEPGERYRYRIDGGAAYPDPASRFQPEGVHGPSEVVAPARFAWTDAHWQGLPLENLILYELHVGTFHPQGDFSGVRKQLEWIKNLGVTAIELMPVADFPGSRNWGYDGVDLFAPARCYGDPDDLRQLVDAAHTLDLGVFLDVVYNHFGPDGAYWSAFSSSYFTSRHKSLWGDAINFDGKASRPVRDFFIENALHWVHEYHIDGLRLDATHTIIDDSPTHFLKELTQRVHACQRNSHPALIIAEDDDNDHRIIRPVEQGGFGLDAVWADDFHHQVRRLIAGDDDGYFRDFSGTPEELVETMRQGWFYTGQHSVHRNRKRGTPTEAIAPMHFVHCIQNHDQVGNRAHGDRLHFKTDLAVYRALSAWFLLSPATPLLFMGQEWAATTPFCFFTDHPEELGKKVTQGRSREFMQFKAFQDVKERRRIPDPQAFETFSKSRLDWQEPENEPHAGIVRLHRALLALRKNESAFAPESALNWDVHQDTLLLKRTANDTSAWLIAACFKSPQTLTLPQNPSIQPPDGKQWQLALHSEEDRFASTPHPPGWQWKNQNLTLDYFSPCTLVFRCQ